MYYSRIGERPKKVLLGGQYAQKSLFDYLQYFYSVHVYMGLGTVTNGTAYDYAIIDSMVLEQSGEKLIQGLISRNPNVRVILRDIPYDGWTPEKYNTNALKKLAEENKHIFFPKNSEIADVVFDLLEEFDKAG